MISTLDLVHFSGVLPQLVKFRGSLSTSITSGAAFPVILAEGQSSLHNWFLVSFVFVLLTGFADLPLTEASKSHRKRKRVSTVAVVWKKWDRGSMATLANIVSGLARNIISQDMERIRIQQKFELLLRLEASSLATHQCRSCPLTQYLCLTSQTFYLNIRRLAASTQLKQQHTFHF